MIGIFLLAGMFSLAEPVMAHSLPAGDSDCGMMMQHHRSQQCASLADPDKAGGKSQHSTSFQCCAGLVCVSAALPSASPVFEEAEAGSCPDSLETSQLQERIFSLHRPPRA